MLLLDTTWRLCYRMADTFYGVLPDSLRRHLVLRTTMQGRFLLISYEELRQQQRTDIMHTGVFDTTSRVVVPFRQWRVAALRPGYFLSVE